MTTTAVGWHGHLALRFRRDAARTLAHDVHDGPLRVLKALYPEGDAVCHHVLVHPPGGIAGGDRLDVEITLEPGAHALITTPGATRYYRSSGQAALQAVQAHVQAGARLAWLPMTAIAYDGCTAENRVRFVPDAGAQMIGIDLLALGLPASHAPFARGRFTQHLEWPGQWLERGVIDAGDARLLQSALGLGGDQPDAGVVGATDAVGVVVGVVDAHLQREADDEGEERLPPLEVDERGLVGVRRDAGAGEDGSHGSREGARPRAGDPVSG